MLVLEIESIIEIECAELRTTKKYLENILKFSIQKQILSIAMPEHACNNFLYGRTRYSR